MILILVILEKHSYLCQNKILNIFERLLNCRIQCYGIYYIYEIWYTGCTVCIIVCVLPVQSCGWSVNVKNGLNDNPIIFIFRLLVFSILSAYPNYLFA